MVQRSFAQFLFSTGRIREARTLYEAALEDLPENDPMTPQTNGYTLQQWGWLEANVAGDVEGASRLFDRAQAQYEEVDNLVMRDQLLAGLAAARQGRPGMAPQAGTAVRDWLKRTTS